MRLLSGNLAETVQEHGAQFRLRDVEESPARVAQQGRVRVGTLELLTRGAFGKARLSRSQADSAAFAQARPPTTKRGNRCTTGRGFERRCWIGTLVRTSP